MCQFSLKEEVIMKKTLIVIALAFGLASGTAFAQMGGSGGTGGQQQQPGGMMGSQQSHQMMGGQMMSQDMMRDMASMMEQMNKMMGKLSHPMNHVAVTDHAKMNEMGKVMHEMAAQMNEMATHIEQGKMDQATVNKMHANMQVMNKKLDAMQKDVK